MGFPDKPSAHLLGANGNVSPPFIHFLLRLTLTLLTSSFHLVFQVWRLALSSKIISCYSISFHSLSFPNYSPTYQLEAYAALIPNV